MACNGMQWHAMAFNGMQWHVLVCIGMYVCTYGGMDVCIMHMPCSWFHPYVWTLVIYPKPDERQTNWCLTVPHNRKQQSIGVPRHPCTQQEPMILRCTWTSHGCSPNSPVRMGLGWAGPLSVLVKGSWQRSVTQLKANASVICQAKVSRTHTHTLMDIHTHPYLVYVYIYIYINDHGIHGWYTHK